jgi:UDP-glucose 4-epimerase
MKVIVTGGAGRLGRSVVVVLAGAGHEVLSLDRIAVEGLPARQFAFELLDPLATRQLFLDERPDAVVHLAAISVPFSRPDPEIFGTNTGLTVSILEASLASGVGALLIASSPTVIGYGTPGWEPHYLPLDEAHPIAPGNAYALSKAAVEHLVRMAAVSDGDRLRVGAFRPCYVIAPEEWLGAATQQGHTVHERLADPSLSAVALFNYLDARDAGDFVLRWLERAGEIPNGSIFFVAAPDSLVRELVSVATARLVPGAASAAAMLAPTAPIFSTALAERLLGWRARRTWRTELRDAVAESEAESV